MNNVEKIKQEAQTLRDKLNDRVNENEFIAGEVFILNYFLSYIDLHNEPVSEDLEDAAFDYAEACKYDGGEKLLCVEHFNAGAKWQKEQFENNRLEHCNSITNEQAELEQGFIDQHLDKHQRIPTYLDAIEYGMKLQKEQMMAKAIDATIEEPEPLLWRVLGELEGLFVAENNLHDGDGVKVIIVKED